MIGYVAPPPPFNPPMKFEIEKPAVQDFIYENVPVTAEILTFHHDEKNFQLNNDKNMSKYDVTSGFLVGTIFFFV